jgi:multicomponent Na+:H+ antiporter subunit B
MSRRLRLLLFALAMLCTLPAVGRIAAHMPRFGAHPLPYGNAINADAPRERHVTNMVSAVNFDYRGFDTLGEEFMLLAAVTGAVVLLRGARGEGNADAPGQVPGRPVQPPSDAVVLAGRLLGPVTLVFGLYVVAHATVTPGGGFQGGVIVASGLLLLYLGEGYRGWRRLVRSEMLDWMEAGGALAFAFCGFGPMLAGAHFMQNVLPPGQMRSLLSGGLMVLENAGVGFAVAGGFGMLFLEFLEETRAPEGDGS